MDTSKMSGNIDHGFCDSYDDTCETVTISDDQCPQNGNHTKLLTNSVELCADCERCIDTTVKDLDCDSGQYDEGSADQLDGPFNKYRKDEKLISSRHTTYFPERKTRLGKQNVDEHTYDMSTAVTGEVLLFNIKNFHSSTGLDTQPRTGTDKDAISVRTVFNDLHFIVHQYDDVSKKEFMCALNEISAIDTSKLSCFVCVVLSHGDEGTVYARDGEIKIKHITGLFETSNWTGKPKVFIFQACRGYKYMDGVDVCTDAVDGPPMKDSTQLLTLPLQADFLYAYSTVSGYFSWRNSTHGSWFIQAMCIVFQEYADDLDIVTMFTRVNNIVSRYKSNTNDKESFHKRQIASIVSQLRKDLYLRG